MLPSSVIKINCMDGLTLVWKLPKQDNTVDLDTGSKGELSLFQNLIKYYLSKRMVVRHMQIKFIFSKKLLFAYITTKTFFIQMTSSVMASQITIISKSLATIVTSPYFVTMRGLHVIE